ncbi:MAG TPA: hypothetical protein VGI64_20635 [Streptosporangiaceae bacterium]|jgi:hypothetical protein
MAGVAASGAAANGYDAADSTALGERFARALAARDGEAMLAVLADPVDFAALTPGRPWQSAAAIQVVDDIILGRWFGPARAQALSLQSVTSGRVGACQHVAYRLLADTSDGQHLVEQQAYYRADGGQITWLRVLCSGYQPVPVRG